MKRNIVAGLIVFGVCVIIALVSYMREDEAVEWIDQGIYLELEPEIHYACTINAFGVKWQITSKEFMGMDKGELRDLAVAMSLIPMCLNAKEGEHIGDMFLPEWAKQVKESK